MDDNPHRLGEMLDRERLRFTEIGIAKATARRRSITRS